MKPVLFVTNHAPPFRVGAFKALHERENVVFALVGGDVRHGGGGTAGSELPFPAIFPSERHVARLAASGRFRAVIAWPCSSSARLSGSPGATSRIPPPLARISSGPASPRQPMAGMPAAIAST